MAEYYDDGGPAFPFQGEDYKVLDAVPTGFRVVTTGMSLRDWFAAQALCGIALQATKGAPFSASAANAYAYADAMLAERAKTKERS